MSIVEFIFQLFRLLSELTLRRNWVFLIFHETRSDLFRISCAKVTSLSFFQHYRSRLSAVHYHYCCALHSVFGVISSLQLQHSPPQQNHNSITDMSHLSFVIESSETSSLRELILKNGLSQKVSSESVKNVISHPPHEIWNVIRFQLDSSQLLWKIPKVDSWPHPCSLRLFWPFPAEEP